MELDIHTKDGKSTGKKAKLNDAVFGIEPNDHAIWLDVKQHLANQRQGTAKTLEKSEVSGSTKKMHRQKGTGGSRKGSIKVIDTVSMTAPKTSEFIAMLKAFELTGRKSVLVVPTKDDNVLLSARNIQRTRVVVASELNTYDIMNATGLLILKDAIAPLEAILTK